MNTFLFLLQRMKSDLEEKIKEQQQKVVEIRQGNFLD